MKTVYLDNGATSFPKAPGVGEAMAAYIEKVGCNVSRGSYAPAYEAAGKLLEIRERLSGLLGGPGPRNLIFTPGATWGLNMLLKGLLRSGDRVAVSPMEHNAVLRPLKQLEKQGVKIDYLPCDERGRLLLEEVPACLGSETRAVVLTHASNVSGGLMPVGEVGRICRERGILFLVDGAQTVGMVPVDMKAMGIDGLAFPGPKASAVWR